MTTKIVGAGSLKSGSFLLVEGVACKIVDVQTSKSGKHGHAKIRLIAIGILDGKKRDVVMPAHDNVEVPIIEKKTAQVLSVAGISANVMDVESYETFDLEIPEELRSSVFAGAQILYWIIQDQRVMKQLKNSAEE